MRRPNTPFTSTDVDSSSPGISADWRTPETHHWAIDCSTRFVDKTPAYWEKLELILRRARGVPVVFVYKTRATAHRSWVQKRHAGEASFRGMWNRFTWQLGIAQRHPLVHTVSFEDLFVHRKGRTRKALFEFLGLKGFSPDFSGKALAAKRGRCHLCDHSVAKRRHNGTNTINS